jgi:hypothetical protein
LNILSQLPTAGALSIVKKAKSCSRAMPQLAKFGHSILGSQGSAVVTHLKNTTGGFVLHAGLPMQRSRRYALLIVAALGIRAAADRSFRPDRFAPVPPKIGATQDADETAK